MRFTLAVLIWLILLPLMVGVKLLGVVFVPIALLFEKDGKLPRIFWFLGNDEDGLDGEDWFASRYSNRFLRRFVWLALRNMAHNFGYHVLSFSTDSFVDCLFEAGNREISDWNGIGGYNVVLVELDRSPYYAFMIYIVLPLTKSRCLRFLAGWKIFNLGVKKVGYVFTFHPWKRFGVKPWEI